MPVYEPVRDNSWAVCVCDYACVLLHISTRNYALAVVAGGVGLSDQRADDDDDDERRRRRRLVVLHILPALLMVVFSAECHGDFWLGQVCVRVCALAPASV